MKRPITIDAVSFSTLIPGMQSGRYDFIAAPTSWTSKSNWSLPRLAKGREATKSNKQATGSTL